MNWLLLFAAWASVVAFILAVLRGAGVRERNDGD
jgi:hypothetical protein